MQRNHTTGVIMLAIVQKNYGVLATGETLTELQNKINRNCYDVQVETLEQSLLWEMESGDDGAIFLLELTEEQLDDISNR